MHSEAPDYFCQRIKVFQYDSFVISSRLEKVCSYIYYSSHTGILILVY